MNGGDLDKVIAFEVVKNQVAFGFFFFLIKVELIQFADSLDVGCNRKKSHG